MKAKTVSLPEAVVVVITKGQKVLLIQRGPDVPDAGYWAPMSGKIEPQEDQAETVVREALEEVGLNVRPVRKVWQNTAANGSHTLHWWLAEWVSGHLRLNSREVTEARWLDVEEILQLENTFNGDREFFRNVFPLL